MKSARSKRSALTDISNQAEGGGSKPAVDVPLKKTRRSTTSGHQDDEIPPPIDVEDGRNDIANQRRPSSSQDATAAAAAVDVVPVKSHRIVRSRALHLKNADPSLCLDMIDDMYNYYYSAEREYSAKPYMSFQKDISPKMRSILVDWIIEIQRGKLQLVGVTSLLIACKFEEVYPPEVSDCVYITDSAYDKSEILTMETSILKILDYHVCVPTGYHFLSRYLDATQASERTRGCASYYAERNLQEVDMLTVPPHVFAAAAVYASYKQQSTQYPALAHVLAWTPLLQEESGLRECDIVEVARRMIQHVSEEVETASRRRLVAAKKKYGNEKNQFISTLVLPTI